MAHAGVIEGGPQELSQVSSIGEVLANAGQSAVHILYIHGIGAKGAGDSKKFQHSICAFLKDCQAPETPASRDYADGGQFAPGAPTPDFRYLGREVWRNAENWAASAPFVDHYLLKRRSGQTIVVDEINWWPLVFPLKCREILDGEAHLAGPNGKLLDLCSAATRPDTAVPGRFLSYSWITDTDAKRLKAMPSKAALLNHDLKDNLFDWGFSDAIMAVGAMHDLFRAIWQPR
jgi:hypothetical protein